MTICFFQRKVEVITVVLDPYRDACFGSAVGRALLIEWFGYESIILGNYLLIISRKEKFEWNKLSKVVNINQVFFNF